MRMASSRFTAPSPVISPVVTGWSNETPTKLCAARLYTSLAAVVCSRRSAGRQVGEVVFDQLQVRMARDAELFDTPEIDRAGAAIGAEHRVALVEQELGQVGAILSGDTGDDCRLAHK